MVFEQREADQIEGVAAPEFGKLVGHGEAFAGLAAALTADRMPSAVLLHGPRGIGKATLAFAVARHVLEATSDETPARIAAQVEALSHPNLFVLRKAKDPINSQKFFSAIRVDDVRATRDALQRTRGRAGYRVCIIDSVDDCNINSANALLKTLEEPPEQTLFIVLSHRPGGMLATIKSRCQSFGLRGLAPDDVAKVISRARPDIPADAIERATQLAAGRPRRGFETLMLEEGDVLDALMAWLASPHNQPTRAQLAIAEALAGAKGAELLFAQDMIRDWMAREAEQAARAGRGARFRLASANVLWDKANALFADADIYNLDRRQTLVAVFDLIRDHARKIVPQG
ncbi:AAA family ATPase [Pelagibacterium lentulum]|uniref:DNA polymerase III subunit delta n=1 Tax=Pelagibacterium lentulum TaxID=2029865 RepID=A0A916REA7_9HYPH|nr:AAA family ATPase [Pelagibacterium lentulum]GGA52868.1 DNA polymerase III subunit delta' [Pelagibacterium lentulum]